MKERGPLPLVLTGLLAALVFIPLLGGCPLFDWDEINFAECAREMLVSGDYSHVQINYRPFWEKPPFFIWLQAASMNLFGVNEFAARFPNALCSIFTLTCLFSIGRRLHSAQMGFTWALLYASTLLPHLYFRSGLIDPWFNLFIFIAAWQCIRLLNEPESKSAWWRGLLGGLLLGLAVLTKGPAAMVILGLGLAGYCLWTRSLKVLLTRGFVLFLFCSLVVSASWFAVEWLRGNGDIVQEFINYQVRLFETGDSGHDGPFLYHFVVLLIGCFPASLLFILYYFKFRHFTPFQRLTRKVMLALFWTVLILFSIVKTKIVHYSSFCYFPLTFVAALCIAQRTQIKINRSGAVFYWVIASVIFLAVLGITLIGFFKEMIIASDLIADEFAVLNLQSQVSWNGLEWLLAPLFLGASVLLFQSLKKENYRWLFGALITNLVFVWLAITVIIPKVELYTQHAAVSFYKAAANRDCDIETHGFKSYGYVFYSERKPSDFSDPVKKLYLEEQLVRLEGEGFSRASAFGLAHLNWLEHGEITRPAYFVVKTPTEHELAGLSNTKKLYQLNGYSFFVRLPANQDLPVRP